MLVSILHRRDRRSADGRRPRHPRLVAGGDRRRRRSYARFIAVVGHPAGLIVLAGLTWAFWQHFFSGVRHIVLDTGAGYELKVNRFWSVMTLVGSLFATALTWYFLLGVGQ